MATPQLDGFDFYSRSSGPPPLLMAAVGARIVGRYLWDGGKGLTVAEADALHGVGLGIGPLYYEADTGYLLDPFTARTHGMAAVTCARQIGVPDHVPICHSLDTDVNMADPAVQMTVAESMRNINTVRGRPEGLYGESDAIDYLWAQGLISFAVNTAAVGWSAGRVSAHAAIWQYAADVTWNGHNVDKLTILDPDAVEAATWWPDGHVISGGGTPLETHDQEDDDMILILGTPPTAPVLLSGGTIAVIADGESVGALKNAGVKVAQVSARDFETIKTRFGR